MSEPRLNAIIFCEPGALRFNGEPLRQTLELPEKLRPRRPLTDGELGSEIFSAHLRPADVPLAFHRESAVDVTMTLRPNLELAQRLEAFGRQLQYLFADGTILYGSQILYHPYSKNVSRHLLPLNVNLNPGLRTRLRSGRLPAWEIDADQVILGVLLSATRAWRLAKSGHDVDSAQLLFCHEDDASQERAALTLESVEAGSEEWGPWRITTALSEPVSGVHNGRARLELDPDAFGGDLNGLAQTFFVDTRTRRLVFHGYNDQLQRLRARLNSAPEESGLTLHLSGHSQIQAALQEMRDLTGEARLHPATTTIAEAQAKPKFSITGDGSFKFQLDLETPDGVWEAHGLPQSSVYLLLSLQHGLGATTGFANTHIAHARRGLKRDRDMKILRSIGYSLLIFFDAASFALGTPLSDGTVAQSEKDVCESLFHRLGALILKSEGWPVQTGSLEELCSKNVTTLIEGFVKQVVADIRGRDISLYLPAGEFRVAGLAKQIAFIFHALVADLAVATQGQCFSRPRAKFFDDFMCGRGLPEREDMTLRRAVAPDVAARMIYHPGIGERYKMPDSSHPPRGTNVLNLLHRGFELSIDGKLVEEFNATEFRPEFNIRESTLEAVTTGGFKIDWFELNPKFFFKGSEISGDQAARLSREGLIEFQGRLYRVKSQDLPQLNRLARFWASLQSGQPGMVRGPRKRKTEETYFQLPRSQTLELLALRASGVTVGGRSERWKQICTFYDSLDQPRPELEVPSSFKTDLQRYQADGVQWISDLFDLGLGGILADDMGLGKTVTSLAFLEIIRRKGKMGPTLICVPTSLTYNWLSEATRFTPEMPMRIFSSRETESMFDFLKQNEHGAIICTYGLLQEHTELFQQIHWNCLILDEAQNLKNITTKRTTAARKLEANFKLCLTGTPLENHYGELYSLFDLIVAGSLGDLAMFREKFVNPVRVLREDIDFLRLKIKPLILRRTKAEVMHQLPPKVEATIKLPFEDEQRKIYRDIAASYNEQVRNAIAKQGEARSQLQMLTALLRLRQVCSDPSSIPGIEYRGEPPKLTTLLDAIRELVESGASALVFTQFLATFERISKSLTAAKIEHFDISGADSRLNREKKIRAFQDSDQGAVMLMTLKTGGVGLNLVKASYIFHIEPWWNPAVENQATDRAHRIGQTKTVQVYRYLIKDSVEEKIEILKDIKAKRFDALFEISETETELGRGSSALTQRDFEFLLG